MKILKIEIENLGPYLGKHAMNFATENPDKNVVLIGGLNGAPLVFRVAFKPTSSISRPQETYNFKTEKMDTLQVKGRHDVCFALRTPVVVEAMTAIVMADLLEIADLEPFVEAD